MRLRKNWDWGENETDEEIILEENEIQAKMITEATINVKRMWNWTENETEETMKMTWQWHWGQNWTGKNKTEEPMKLKRQWDWGNSDTEVKIKLKWKRNWKETETEIKIKVRKMTVAKMKTKIQQRKLGAAK